jgi:hypothetical protein
MIVLLACLLFPSFLFNLFLYKECKRLTTAKNFFERLCNGLRNKLDQEREDSINLTMPVTKEHASRFMSAWNTWRAKE